MPEVTIDLSEVDSYINPVYRPYLEDYRRFQVFKGGAGAGKSVFVGGQKIVYNMLATPGYNVMALRKVGVDSRNSTFAEIKKGISAWGLDDLFVCTVSPMEVLAKPTRNKCLFFGLDDVEKRKSVTFDTGDLVAIWGEEASEFTHDDFMQLNLRLRGKGNIPKHMMLSFNPIDVDSWLKTEFFDRPLSVERGYVLETTYLDNQFLDEPYKLELLSYKDIDENYFNVYVRNKWGTRSTTTVFRNVVIHDFDFVEEDFSNRRLGLDFGWEHANALEGIGFRDGELYCWYEQYGKHQKNSELIAATNESKLPKEYTIKADSAEPDKIAEWQSAGYKNCFKTDKNPGSVKRQVDWLAALPKIHVHATRCPNLARELPRFSRRKLKSGQILDNEFVEIDDDTVAALRYSVDDLVGAEAAQNSHFFIKRRT